MPPPLELAPAEWVRRWAHLVPPGARVLDLACGMGRHARFFADRGADVWAVDRDADALSTLADLPRVHAQLLDLEGAQWPLRGMRFDAIVVTRYLYRPRLENLLTLLDPAGILIYETFMQGNEAFGRPRNPEHLLQEGELLRLVAGRLRVLAFEQGLVERPSQALVQRICASGMARTEPAQLNFRAERP